LQAINIKNYPLKIISLLTKYIFTNMDKLKKIAMKFSIGSCLIAFVLSASAADHNPILPQPRKIVYGKAQLTLKGLSIGFAGNPVPEDKFAAQTLAEIISKLTGTVILVKETPANGASIIFERTGNPDPLPVPGEKPGPDSRESYRIKVTTKGIRITAKSSAGIFYGVQTLRQMIEGSGEKAIIPEVEIEDWPSLAYRGYMMDMNHSHFLKIEEIKNQIDFLSRWKANWYLFYSEASIELEGFPLLMADARYSKDEVKEIINYARARHIDVIPNMELYGHLHDLFRLEHYSDMSVLQHGREFLPDDPRVKPLVDNWVTQISNLFPSDFFHIGFDETWMLEYEAKILEKKPEDIYLKMLKQTTDIVEKQGKRPMIWADMLQKYPSIIPKVSQKIIAVPWHYDPLDDTRYEQSLGPFAKAGIEMIVQGASMNWQWVTPDFEKSFLNADMLIKAGRKYNATGFINSGWNDDSQTIDRMSFPDMAYGSVASWQNEPVDRDNFFNKYCRAQYPPDLAALAEKALRSLTLAESLMRQALGVTDAAFWANPFSARSVKTIESNREKLHNGRLAAEDAQEYIRSALKYGVDTTSFYAMLVGARMIDYIGLKYLYAGEIADFWNQLSKNPSRDDYRLLISIETNSRIHGRTADILDAIITVKEIFRQAWLNEYTPFRLGVILGKFDLEFQYWLKFQRNLDLFNYREDVPLVPLETLFKTEYN
jgi:hexosaminidase